MRHGIQGVGSFVNNYVNRRNHWEESVNDLDRIPLTGNARIIVDNFEKILFFIFLEEYDV